MHWTELAPTTVFLKRYYWLLLVIFMFIIGILLHVLHVVFAVLLRKLHATTAEKIISAAAYIPQEWAWRCDDIFFSFIDTMGCELMCWTAASSFSVEVIRMNARARCFISLFYTTTNIYWYASSTGVKHIRPCSLAHVSVLRTAGSTGPRRIVDINYDHRLRQLNGRSVGTTICEVLFKVVNFPETILWEKHQ